MCVDSVDGPGLRKTVGFYVSLFVWDLFFPDGAMMSPLPQIVCLVTD